MLPVSWGQRETLPPKTNSVLLNHSAVYSRSRVQLKVAKHHIIQIPQPTPARTAARAGKRETLYTKLMVSSCQSCVLVNQLHAVRGLSKFDGWSIRIHSYEAYKQGKKRELNFYWHVKRNQFNVRFEKNISALIKQKQQRSKAVNLMYQYHQAACDRFLHCFFGQERNAIAVQANLFLGADSAKCLFGACGIQGKTGRNDLAHSTGQTERPFPLLQ